MTASITHLNATLGAKMRAHETIMKLKDEMGDRSYRNWFNLSDAIRRECLHELKSAMPADLFWKWLCEYRAKGAIEEDNPSFHYDPGMAVRNILRQRLADSELSAIDGNECYDWDDLYIGALRELFDTAA
jgi:hypothetical protein